MRINPLIFGGMVLAVFMGVIFGFQQAGLWSTSGKINASGGTIQPSALDVDTIKGWMTSRAGIRNLQRSRGRDIIQFRPACRHPGLYAAKRSRE